MQPNLHPVPILRGLQLGLRIGRKIVAARPPEFADTLVGSDCNCATGCVFAPTAGHGTHNEAGARFVIGLEFEADSIIRILPVADQEAAVRPVGALNAKLALFDLPIVGVAANHMPTAQILAIEQWHEALSVGVG